MGPAFAGTTSKRRSFNSQTAYSGVVARLDRAIQYSATARVSTRYHGVLDAPRLKRGMTIERHGCALSRRNAPGLCMSHPPDRGRGECRVPAAPAASRAKWCKAHECRHHGRTGTPGIPARNGFNGFLRTLPGDRAFLSPSPALVGARLDAGVEASGPHDFAVHVSAVRQRAAVSTASRTNVRDDRDTPLFGNETVRVMKVIWVYSDSSIVRKTGCQGAIFGFVMGHDLRRLFVSR
jgi:hypothetical protein